MPSFIDAADNSVTAVSTQSPPERNLVHDFVALGDLPTNVRFVVTGRTGRLPTLNLPPCFALLEITGFARDESAAHVRGVWNDAPEAWIDDFHHLSGGNPRVRQHARLTTFVRKARVSTRSSESSSNTPDSRWAEHAIGSMSAEEKRAVARDLTIVVGDAGIRLGGHDHFP